MYTSFENLFNSLNNSSQFIYLFCFNSETRYTIDIIASENDVTMSENDAIIAFIGYLMTVTNDETSEIDAVTIENDFGRPEHDDGKPKTDVGRPKNDAPLLKKHVITAYSNTEWPLL